MSSTEPPDRPSPDRLSKTTEARVDDTDAAGTEAVASGASALFDLRTVIAILFGVYGIGLTVLGLVDNDPRTLEKSAGIDMNLWTGLGMIVVALIFIAWARLRPLVPPTT